MLRPDVIIEKIFQAQFDQNTVKEILIDTPAVKIPVNCINNKMLKSDIINSEARSANNEKCYESPLKVEKN